MNIQEIVDRVFERRSVDKFIPVTQYEYKQREGRHMMDSTHYNDELAKLRKALEENGIEVEEEATDEEIITAMLTEEQNFQHQQKVNNYNERVTRYKEGSLVERVRIMFEGAPKKPKRNPAVDENFYEEKASYVDGSISKESEGISEGEISEIHSILGGVTKEDVERIEKNGDKEEAAELAKEVLGILEN